MVRCLGIAGARDFFFSWTVFCLYSPFWDCFNILLHCWLVLPALPPFWSNRSPILPRFTSLFYQATRWSWESSILIQILNDTFWLPSLGQDPVLDHWTLNTEMGHSVLPWLFLWKPSEWTWGKGKMGGGTAPNEESAEGPGRKGDCGRQNNGSTPHHSFSPGKL